MSTPYSFSVAMTTYNGEKYLRAQLDSILGQTYAPHEIVICDDGSTDGTLSILEEYRSKHPELFCIHINSHNLGFVKNFEQAIALCQGDIIALSDQDDSWLPYKLQRLHETFLRGPRCVLAFSNAKLIDADGRDLGGNTYPQASLSAFYEDFPAMPFPMRKSIKGCTLAFRAVCRPCFLPIGQSGWGHDDWLFFLAPLAGNIEYLPEPLILHRRHGLNTGADSSGRSFGWRMRQHQENSSIDAYEADVKKWAIMLEHLERLHGLDDQEIDQARLRQAKYIVQERLTFAQQRLTLRQKKRLARFYPGLSLFYKKRYRQFGSGIKALVRDLIA